MKTLEVSGETGSFGATFQTILSQITWRDEIFLIFIFMTLFILCFLVGHYTDDIYSKIYNSRLVLYATFKIKDLKFPCKTKIMNNLYSPKGVSSQSSFSKQHHSEHFSRFQEPDANWIVSRVKWEPFLKRVTSAVQLIHYKCILVLEELEYLGGHKTSLRGQNIRYSQLILWLLLNL